MLPSTLYNMTPMYLQSLQLLRPRCIYKKIHWGQGHKNVAHHPPHHIAYVSAKFEVVTSIGLGGYAFTRKYII